MYSVCFPNSDGCCTDSSGSANPHSNTTPTPIPLSELNLEDILIKPGDLPAGFSGGQIKDVLPGVFDKLNVPKADQFIFQQLVRNGDLTGGVVLLLFTSLERC